MSNEYGFTLLFLLITKEEALGYLIGFTNEKALQFFLLVLLFVVSAIPASASDFCVDGIYYNRLSDSDNEVEVCEPDEDNQCSGDVVIPSEISVSGATYKVSAIGDNAFFNFKNVTKVTIPNTVSIIKNFAFGNVVA